MIFGPHHALDIEPDALRVARCERAERFGIARQQPAAKGSQFALLDDQTEFDGIEPEPPRSEEHTSELQSLMRISYAVFCLKKKTKRPPDQHKISKNITH